MAQEDAAELNLGPDFQGATTLTISEVALLLEHKRAALAEEMKQRGEDVDTALSNIFLKASEYVSVFDHYKSKEAAKEVRELLTSKGLEQFEIAALANLVPDTADEARTLIPSLAERFDDDELTEIIESLTSFRKFTSS